MINNNNFEHLLNKFLIKKGLRKIVTNKYTKFVYRYDKLPINSFCVNISKHFKNRLYCCINIETTIGDQQIDGNYYNDVYSFEEIENFVSLKS